MRCRLSLSPHKAAALFVDLQEEHRRDARYLVAGFEALLANVQVLQRAARLAGIPLFHSAYIVDPAGRDLRPFHPVMADGTSAFSDKSNPYSAICPEVGPMGDEDVIVKTEASVFGSGSLTQAFKAAGVEWVFIAGVWTEACIGATVKDATERGFRVVLVKDACGSGSLAMHQTGILNLANRLYGGGVTDTIGACRMMAGETVEAWTVEGAVPLRFTYENAAMLYDEL